MSAASMSATTELAGPTPEMIADLRQASVPEASDVDVRSLPTVENSRILVVDDEPLNLKIVRKYLKMSGYDHITTTTEPRDVFEFLEAQLPDLILLDVMMPEISGLDLLAMLKQDPKYQFIPVVILTAHTEPEVKSQALKSGAADFIGKPIDPHELLPRVKNLLSMKVYQNGLKHYAEQLEHRVRQRTAALARSREHVIQCLARAAEYRDNETGRHVLRVGRYAAIIAHQMGLGDEYAQMIEHAAKLHDVGKIGIPDGILLKPGKLEPEEFELMQRHCGLGRRVCERIESDDWTTWQKHVNIGASILDDDDSPLLRMASRIAMTHHEKWDGSGYPLGLAGEQIPLEGRITAVADVFDALSSKRPYKAAFPLEKCLAILEEGRGKHFDTKVLDAFFAVREKITAVQLDLADVD